VRLEHPPHGTGETRKGGSAGTRRDKCAAVDVGSVPSGRSVGASDVVRRPVAGCQRPIADLTVVRGDAVHRGARLAARHVNELDTVFPPPEPLRCEITRRGETVWLHVSGELDLDSADQVEQELSALRAAGSNDLVLDLRGLTFMDSTGLRLVIRWHIAAGENGFGFAIVPGPEVVQRVFRLTGMEGEVGVAEPPADT
jgi:anti-sigma B factor antagonist